jgi:hypothetical protein
VVLLAGCGGGSSSPSQSNGISVPTRPDSVTNNATLLGIDANGNGIRDDIDRVIAASARSAPNGVAQLESAAKAAQKAIESPSLENFKKFDCTLLGLNGADAAAFINSIFNTSQRIALLQSYRAPAGTVIDVTNHSYADICSSAKTVSVK